MKLHGRTLWIATIVTLQLTSIWYFLRHAPRSDNSAQRAQLRRHQSPANVDLCLSSRDRDVRFVHRNACVTIQQRADAIDGLVAELARLFDALAIDYWLVNSSLRSQHRSSGVDPLDVHGDIGILPPGLQTLQTMRIALRTGYELNVVDSALHAAINCDAQIPVRLVDTTHGFYVNVYVFLDTISTNDHLRMLAPAAGRAWSQCVHCAFVTDAVSGDARVRRFEVPRDWILPLRTCAFGSTIAKCPHQVEQYLTHLYGDKHNGLVLWQ